MRDWLEEHMMTTAVIVMVVVVVLFAYATGEQHEQCLRNRLPLAKTGMDSVTVYSSCDAQMPKVVYVVH